MVTWKCINNVSLQFYPSAGIKTVFESGLVLFAIHVHKDFAVDFNFLKEGFLIIKEQFKKR